MRRSFEFPLDVKKLTELLGEESSQNSTGETYAGSAAIKDFGEVLSANVRKERVRKFLTGLRGIYGVHGELQIQMIMATFIKESLGQDLLPTFNRLVGQAAYDTFSPRMKRMLLSELN